VVARYEHVQSFLPETFWYIYLTLRGTDNSGGKEQNKKETEFTWRRIRLFEFDVSLAIYENVLGKPAAKVTKVTQKPTKKW
jgi:DNA topoisomerase-3